MPLECFVTISSSWEALGNQGLNNEDEQNQEPSLCNAKFSYPRHWISITTIVTLLVVVLGAGLNLVWAQNIRLREMERDHEIRMKLHDLQIKGMDHARAIAEMNARFDEQKQVEKAKEIRYSRAVAEMKTRMEEQTEAEASRKGEKGEKQQNAGLSAAVLAAPRRQMRQHAFELPRMAFR